jgi:hypothetical protein
LNNPSENKYTNNTGTFSPFVTELDLGLKIINDLNPSITAKAANVFVDS